MPLPLIIVPRPTARATRARPKSVVRIVLRVGLADACVMVFSKKRDTPERQGEAPAGLPRSFSQLELFGTTVNSASRSRESGGTGAFGDSHETPIPRRSLFARLRRVGL